MNNFKVLQQFCNDIIVKQHPDILYNLEDFINIPEKALEVESLYFENPGAAWRRRSSHDYNHLELHYDIGGFSFEFQTCLIEVIKYIRPVKVLFWFGEIVCEDSDKLFRPDENSMSV
ncbi:14526_t:CDS:2 [Gigaspora rosea]|nr:14526_t:CDS:2 [Gigaspora rosea]